MTRLNNDQTAISRANSLVNTIVGSAPWAGKAMRSLLAVTALSTGLLFTQEASAQVLLGGEQLVKGVSTAEERVAQSDLWVMDIAFKPMRQIVVEVTDPKTGEKKPEYIWYMTYRAFNRPIAQREVDNQPVNEFDPPVLPPMFVPEFTLVTQSETPEVIQDTICPEALAAINKREKFTFQNSVEAVAPIPPAAEPKSPDEQAISGVAIFRNVNPKAKRYTVYLTGFSNGIRTIEGPDGQPLVQHKTLMQKYWRPGDEFDQKEFEIRLDGEPEWIYR